MKLKGLILSLFLVTFAWAQTEIEYWDWLVTQEPAIQAILAAFEAANPDIKVNKTLTATTSYKETLNAAVQSGSAPDIYLIPGEIFRDYANQGNLYDLNEFADVEEFKASFPDPASNFVDGANIIDGKLYSAPFNGPSKPWLQLYINTALYKEAGLVDADGNPTLPVTWEEFVANSRTIKEKTGKPGLGFSMQQSWAASWAWKVCNYSGTPMDGFLDAFDWRTGQYSYSTNPCYKQVLTDLIELSKDGTIDEGTMAAAYDDEGARAKFAENGFAHLFAGEWVIPGFSQTHPDFADFTATHIPFINGEPQSFFGAGVGGVSYVINAETENPEAAWALFKFMHTPEAAQIWSENGQGLALQTPQPYDQYATNDAFKHIFSSTDLVRIYPEPSLRNPEIAQLQITLLGTSVDDLFVQILTGQVTDIDAALADLDKRKSEALDLAIADGQAAGLTVSRDDFVFPDWNPLENYQN